jgi:hypothetical protein
MEHDADTPPEPLVDDAGPEPGPIDADVTDNQEEHPSEGAAAAEPARSAIADPDAPHPANRDL